jgi:mitochondrial fission protein ELM1
MKRAINLWRLSDGRAGHDNQSLGLVEALSRQHAVNTVTIDSNGAWRGVRNVLARTASSARPQLIIGAGHATHAALILGAWRYRARSIVMMSPSLPYALFDLCIVPEHDGIRQRKNIVYSIGALNRIQVSTDRDPMLALILLGGPSRHYRWDQHIILKQVNELIAARPQLQWIIATSPRTPHQTTKALSTVEKATLMRYENTAPDWLPTTLSQASLVWVSEDSVSMIYEALSSGVPTGLVRIQQAPRETQPAPHRLASAVHTLRESGRLIATQQWLDGSYQATRMEPLREADRCAQQILERWPDLH